MSLIMDPATQLQKAKADVTQDVQKATQALFYIGDTGLDGKLTVTAAGDFNNVLSLFVNACTQSDSCRHLVLMAAEHLR